jgi:hypothetical protein
MAYGKCCKGKCTAVRDRCCCRCCVVVTAGASPEEGSQSAQRACLGAGNEKVAHHLYVSEMRSHMTHDSRNDFCEQILADQEAMSRMQDEGGGSQPRDVTSPSTAVAAPALRFDSSPLIAIFREPASANGALQQLRSLGIANENIGVAYSDAVISSPANDPATYRATGKARDGSEFMDPVLPDSFRAPSQQPTQASPNSAGYNGNFEADQYHHPLHHVMVTVQVDSNQRQPVRDLLIRFGAAR